MKCCFQEEDLIVCGSLYTRPLWTQKLSDDKLKKLLDKVDDLQITGATEDDELQNLAETWYDNSVGMERFMALSIEVWKEAAFRWRNK